jgi:uroporphyrinogen III methyltransferase/synthase
MSRAVGRVYLVGAGPGDPGLLTLRGAECLREADVVLYDYLASPLLLAHARPGVELVCLGRHGQGRLMSPGEVNEAMIRAARRGRTVVRLKGGDPTIFARAADELAALEAANVPYEIVPGVSAAQAASSHAGIPLTQRDQASCVALVAGQESGDKRAKDQLDYSALAKFPGTLVFYMGVTTAAEWSAALVAAGKSPRTPVAIVRRCSFPDQQTIYSTLGEVATLLGGGTGKLRPPAVVIVGDVARQRRAENWFTSRPLFGRTVLITRPEGQGDALAARLRNLGADVMFQPAITISETASWEPVDAAIDRLATFDWLVFSSANGVAYFMNRLETLGHDARRLGGVRLAAIGPATADELKKYHLSADVQPDEYRAEALANTLAASARGKRILLARASRGREVLAEMLTAAGAVVVQICVYESCDVLQPDQAVAASLEGGRIDWTTVTSSAIARSLARLFGQSLHKTRLAAISPLTAEVLAELGHPADVVAETHTTVGIVNAILAAERQRAN